MDKLEYIARQLAKAAKKKYEHYVVSRIWHLLNDTALKMVTQQYVARPEGRAMTDMYFPQVSIHIEIDEGHHQQQIEWDNIREADIINATGHEIQRVDVTQPLEIIHARIDSLVSQIRMAKDKKMNFRPWDPVAEQNPKTYIKRGYIDLADDVAFRTMVDAANCFGNQYKPKGIWKGAAIHPKEPGKFIWFPRLYPNGQWNNAISRNEMTITEKCRNIERAKNHIEKAIREQDVKRIVFARVRSPLGDVMYRFKGEYGVDVKQTNQETGTVLIRTHTRVATYR